MICFSQFWSENVCNLLISDWHNQSLAIDLNILIFSFLRDRFHGHAEDFCAMSFDSINPPYLFPAIFPLKVNHFIYTFDLLFDNYSFLRLVTFTSPAVVSHHYHLLLFHTSILIFFFLTIFELVKKKIENSSRFFIKLSSVYLRKLRMLLWLRTMLMLKSSMKVR